MSDLIVTRGDGVPVPDQKMGAELFKAQARIAALETGLRDLRDHGLRFDLNPTHEWDGTQETAEKFWHQYARRMDESVRERARNLLGE